MQADLELWTLHLVAGIPDIYYCITLYLTFSNSHSWRLVSSQGSNPTQVFFTGDANKYPSIFSMPVGVTAVVTCLGQKGNPWPCSWPWKLTLGLASLGQPWQARMTCKSVLCLGSWLSHKTPRPLWWQSLHSIEQDLGKLVFMFPLLGV